MARPRKPTVLHMIRGTLRADRHGDLLDGEPAAEGAPMKPVALQGRPEEIWNEITARTSWLRAADSYALFAFCCLAAELERAPTKFVASRYSQLRSYGIRLGLDPSARASLGASAVTPRPANAADSKPAARGRKGDPGRFFT
ncbi:MAG: hypothetical protein HY943_21100 [Gammaproteobacteria bacterium]|nr:hypothetical protein [Gammaproteobacteria bacterium]